MAELCAGLPRGLLLHYGHHHRDSLSRGQVQCAHCAVSSGLVSRLRGWAVRLHHRADCGRVHECLQRGAFLRRWLHQRHAGCVPRGALRRHHGADCLHVHWRLSGRLLLPGGRHQRHAERLPCGHLWRRPWPRHLCLQRAVRCWLLWQHCSSDLCLVQRAVRVWHVGNHWQNFLYMQRRLPSRQVRSSFYHSHFRCLRWRLCCRLLLPAGLLQRHGSNLPYWQLLPRRQRRAHTLPLWRLPHSGDLSAPHLRAFCLPPSLP